ncbi:MAG: 16S rRNA processing protein RimM [Clostridia bacterium]|nr:16S rRNA processing protein RimM [Clostridia bacterium]
MSKEYLEAGKIVALHGVKGEMRLKPWSDDAAFLSAFNTVYLDAAGTQAKRLVSARPHGNITLIKIEGVDTPEHAEELRGHIIYIKKSDAKLPEGHYFVDDIIGLSAVDEADGTVLGTIRLIESYPANEVWHIQNGQREYLIPNVPAIVKKISPDEGKVYIFKMKGLFEDED